MTAVGDPPRPAPDTRPAPRQAVRSRTTPAKLRLLLAGLVSLCLIWGAVAAWVVSQRASGAADVVSTSEPLALDGQQIYRAMSAWYRWRAASGSRPPDRKALAAVASASDSAR